MRLLRHLFLILLCIATALVLGMYTYEPGHLFYQTEVVLYLPGGEPVPAAVEALKRGKDRLESEDFRMQAAARLTALQIRNTRQLGPSQWVDRLEDSQDSLAGFLMRACLARLDESVPALILSVSAESETLVNTMAVVVPELLGKVHESNEAVALSLLADEIRIVLIGVEQQDQNLTHVLWNLKGSLNTKFADRPISKRGAIPPPSPASAVVTSSSANVNEALATVREKLNQRVGYEKSQALDGLPSLGNARQLLSEAVVLRDRVATLIGEASALFSTVDSATSMENGPLPESLGRLNDALLEARGRREALVEQSKQIVSPGVPEAEPAFMIERMDPQVSRVGGKSAWIHYLVWGLCGFGIGMVLSLAGWTGPTGKRRGL